MREFEKYVLTTEHIQSILWQVRIILEEIDDLAKKAGDIVSISNGPGKGIEFSENVAKWLFNDTDKLKKRNKLKEPVQSQSSLRPRTENHIHFNSTTTDSPSFASILGRDTISSNRFANQLISHNLSSDSTYRSPRSRYLENRSVELAQIREKLSKVSISGNSVSRYSACDLVGSISGVGSSFKSREETKQTTRGVVVSLAGGSYANVKSCVDKSRAMFGDSITPDNPYFIPPWERRRNEQNIGRRRFIL